MSFAAESCRVGRRWEWLRWLYSSTKVFSSERTWITIFSVNPIINLGLNLKRNGIGICLGKCGKVTYWRLSYSAIVDFPAPEMEPESAHVVSAVSVPSSVQRFAMQHHPHSRILDGTAQWTVYRSITGARLRLLTFRRHRWSCQRWQTAGGGSNPCWSTRESQVRPAERQRAPTTKMTFRRHCMIIYNSSFYCDWTRVTTWREPKALDEKALNLDSQRGGPPQYLFSDVCREYFNVWNTEKARSCEDWN